MPGDWRLPLSLLLAASVLVAASHREVSQKSLSHALVKTAKPADDGTQILRDINRFAGQYWARTSGYDAHLPPHVNGHDEFESAWAKEVQANLHGLPVTVLRQAVSTPGFLGLPPKRDGMNIIAVVPGSLTPGVAVIVGAHPDGEPFSKGSAYDDTSGSMVLLNLARALGKEWRSRGLPVVTVEFVLFDAEEQGLIGSNAYAFNYRHGALMPRPIYMINEEQSGIGYPVRPFGLASKPPIAVHGITTGSLPTSLRGAFGTWIPPQPLALALTIDRLKKARSQVFRELRRAHQQLHYRGGSRSVFRPGDQHFLSLGPTSLCCSDNDPFETLGLPTTTFAGDSNYYDQHAPSWSYPYDQPEDTPTAMACDTGGSPQPSQALQAALAVPLDMSRILVNNYAPPAKRKPGVTVFSNLPVAKSTIEFHLVGTSTANWAFGDGTTGTGIHLSHIYARAGVYGLTVKHGKSVDHFNLQVLAKLPAFGNHLRVHPPPRRPWHPSELQSIAGCH